MVAYMDNCFVYRPATVIPAVVQLLHTLNITTNMTKPILRACTWASILIHMLGFYVQQLNCTTAYITLYAPMQRMCVHAYMHKGHKVKLLE